MVMLSYEIPPPPEQVKDWQMFSLRSAILGIDQALENADTRSVQQLNSHRYALISLLCEKLEVPVSFSAKPSKFLGGMMAIVDLDKPDVPADPDPAKLPRVPK